MKAPIRTPFDRLLPAWLGVSLMVHATVLVGAGAVVAGRPAPEPTPPATRVLLAGRIVVPPAPAQPDVPPARPIATAQPRHATRPASIWRRLTGRRAAGDDTFRRARGAAHDAQTSATGESPTPDKPPAEAVGGFADASPRPGERHSASAPALAATGTAHAGPLAGGGAQALTAPATGPVSFAVAQAPGSGGSGPGYGGSGSGLGAGGSAGGVGGGGTPGGSSLSSAGLGGGTSGQIAPGGTVGGGGRTGAGSPGASGDDGGARSGPEHGGSAPPTPAPHHDPEPKPETKPEPAPEPKPSQADLSSFRSMVQSRINGAKRYPSSARESGQEGTVRVSFSISPSGQPSGIGVASSSGYQALDAEATRAVSRSAPFRPFPQHMNSSIRVTATVIFRLN